MERIAEQNLVQEAVHLLEGLIRLPSFSREETQTAALLKNFFTQRRIKNRQTGNNIIVENKFFDPAKPTILLNSHHDTVRPNPSYTKDPFDPFVEEGKLFGLGSNDAGGALCSLIASFLYFHDSPDMAYNLLLAATAEEEISGVGGIESVLQHLPPIEFGIVGEPTLMQMAVAERGLMVIDCLAKGKAGHAARGEGINAISIAVKDILAIENYRFERISELLGPVKLTVSVINTENAAHNVIPDLCRFVVDVRVNELYQFEEILSLLKSTVSSEMKARSMRLRSSMIDLSHPLVQSGIRLGLSYYGSPTSSDKALMPFPALKIGPGDSARSHTADEFIFLEEIAQGIDLYINLLSPILYPAQQ